MHETLRVTAVVATFAHWESAHAAETNLLPVRIFDLVAQLRRRPCLELLFQFRTQLLFRLRCGGRGRLLLLINFPREGLAIEEVLSGLLLRLPCQVETLAIELQCLHDLLRTLLKLFLRLHSRGNLVLLALLAHVLVIGVHNHILAIALNSHPTLLRTSVCQVLEVEALGILFQHPDECTHREALGQPSRGNILPLCSNDAALGDDLPDCKLLRLVGGAPAQLGRCPHQQTAQPQLGLRCVDQDPSCCDIAKTHGLRVRSQRFE
mmetsp:Transcript_78919/g.176873  ORF Transcript_78919/g.176873 Transcript_78919/m.176873 type:complete len:264 (+) Transcript_78919:168-959(+)